MGGKPGFYEFFAGGGMARAGLGPGWRCLFANDFDRRKAEAYRANWGGDALHVGNVGAVTTAQLPGVADLVWGSFPCQDLSLAGAGAGLRTEGDRDRLVDRRVEAGVQVVHLTDVRDRDGRNRPEKRADLVSGGWRRHSRTPGENLGPVRMRAGGNC